MEREVGHPQKFSKVTCELNPRSLDHQIPILADCVTTPPDDSVIVILKVELLLISEPH